MILDNNKIMNRILNVLQVISLQQKMNIIKNEYNSIKQAKLDEYITSLPSKQR